VAAALGVLKRGYEKERAKNKKLKTEMKEMAKCLAAETQLKHKWDNQRRINLERAENKRARRARTATISIGINFDAGGGAVLAPDWQPFLECPISHEIMVDPVVAEDGQTYERRALARWLESHGSSPMTSQPMGRRMVPNYALKSMITKFNSTSA
jgi:hypothetical protein